LEAVGSRSLDSARSFARKWKAPKAFGSYEKLLGDPAVEAVYIAPPHSFHAQWAIQAARSGKHILCEKPLALNYPDAKRIVEAARKKGVFLMEAFMYRFHPQMAKLVELIRKGTIGRVRLIQASFCFDAPMDLKDRLFNRELGGGCILDVGCYPISLVRFIAGVSQGRPFAEPQEVEGTALIGEKSGVDEIALASLKFPAGILAEISCASRAVQKSVVTIIGSKGQITIPSPWFGTPPKSDPHILVQWKNEKKPLKIRIRGGQNLYGLEADAVARAVRRGQKQFAAMGWADSLGNMVVLDRWRKAVGMSYGKKSRPFR
jgi:predicted dehydrogenase